MDGLSREQAFGLYADLEDAGYDPTFKKERGSYRVSTYLRRRMLVAEVVALERLASVRGAMVTLVGLRERLCVNFLPREKEEDAPSEGEGR